jgi:beta-phosphoglucomutase
MLYSAIIFDFNGVLLWDTLLHEQVWKQYSTQLRGAPFTETEMAVHVHGRNNQHALEFLLGRSLDQTEAERLSNEKELIYQSVCLAMGVEYQLSPGAVELLDFLVERQIPRAIATASPKINVDFFVQRLELARWFDLDHIVYDDGVRPGKPSPDIYLQASRSLGLPPAQCVVVEDSRSGIQAACAAGIGYIVALGAPERHPQLRQIEGVNTVISTLREFPRQELFGYPT